VELLRQSTLAASRDVRRKQGDYVIIDFNGGEACWRPLGGGRGLHAEIGSGESLETSRRSLSMNADERKKFAVTFPMDYAEGARCACVILV